MTVEAVTPVRGSHGIRRLVGQERRRQVLIQRQEQARSGGEPRPGVVDHEQVVTFGELIDRLVGELLQRPLLPDDFHAGV